MRAIRTSSWKLVRDFFNPERDELYHLTEDPGEHVNLIDSSDGAIVNRKQDLHDRLVAWMDSIDDPMTPGRTEIVMLAGIGEPGYTGDGADASRAQLNQLFGLVVGLDRCLYFCDTANHVIRRIDPEGIITTIAGNGTPGYSGDGGLATEAELFEPYEVRFDREGDLYFVEMRNNLIRKIDMKTRRITTVAGTGQQGFGGDGGPATEAIDQVALRGLRALGASAMVSASRIRPRLAPPRHRSGIVKAAKDTLINEILWYRRENGHPGVPTARCRHISGGATGLHGGPFRARWQWARLVSMLEPRLHHLHPDRQREPAAVTSRHHRFIVVQSHPDAAGQLAGVAEEPGIPIIVRRSRLASRRSFPTQPLG